MYELKKRHALGRFTDGEEFYIELKAELEKEIEQMQRQIIDVPEKISNLKQEFETTIPLLTNLNKIWGSTDTPTKKELQYLVFPEGIKYDSKKREYLTANVNQFFDFAVSFSSNYNEGKKGTTPLLLRKSPSAEREGFS